jgi:hypothetical protein
VYDYLRHATHILNSESLSTEDYREWLTGHQKALLGALERYVESQKLGALDLIQKGWRWFRFSKNQVVIHGDNPMVWIGRHDPNIKDLCLDALELEAMWGIPLMPGMLINFVKQGVNP